VAKDAGRKRSYIPPKPTSYRCEGDLHTWEFDGGVAFRVAKPHADSSGRLWSDIEAILDGALIHPARIDILNQRDRFDFHVMASEKADRVHWGNHLESLIAPLKQVLSAGDRESTASDDAPELADEWPTLGRKATLVIDPYTEADPTAVLLNILTAFGNMVGPSAHFRVEHTKHPLGIFVTLVG
jgi:hypothetical protein